MKTGNDEPGAEEEQICLLCSKQVEEPLNPKGPVQLGGQRRYRGPLSVHLQLMGACLKSFMSEKTLWAFLFSFFFPLHLSPPPLVHFVSPFAFLLNLYLQTLSLLFIGSNWMMNFH